MFKPVAMSKLYILLMDSNVNAVTKALGEVGLLHLTNTATSARRHLLDQVQRQEEINGAGNLLSRCHNLLHQLNISRTIETAATAEKMAAETLTLAQIDQILDDIEARYNQLQQDTQSLMQEATRLELQLTQVDKLPFDNVSFAELRDLNHLYIASGRLSPSQLPDTIQAIGDRAVVVHEHDAESNSEQLLVVAPRKQRWALDDQLSKAGFRAEPLPDDLSDTPQREVIQLRGRIGQTQQQLRAQQAKSAQLGQQYHQVLLAAQLQLQQALAISHAQEHFGRTAQTYCISGWIPRDSEAQVRTLIDDICGGAAVIEVVDAAADPDVQHGDDQVPVQFGGSPLLKPFQTLVSAYGAPRYDEVEPSLFVAFSFVVMFGIMFGDVGQGAIIAGVGLYLMRSRRPTLAVFRNAGIMLLFCGCAAMVFGFMYGSIFGYEHLLPALWLEPLHDVINLFKTTVIVGIAFISIGMLINIYNKIRARCFFDSILDRFGVIGVVLYWGSIGLGLKAMHAGKLGGIEVLLIIVLPLLILFLREPLRNLLQRRQRLFDHGVLNFVLDGAIETLETMTAFLGSTVSFVRVGGFALSHAALCLAIYTLADMLQDLPGAGFWQFLLIAAGNLFVIVLEGMVATIQGIRLQYYELFSKYFAGDGVLYKPFQLQTMPPTVEQGKS